MGKKIANRVRYRADQARRSIELLAEALGDDVLPAPVKHLLGQVDELERELLDAAGQEAGSETRVEGGAG